MKDSRIRLFGWYVTLCVFVCERERERKSLRFVEEKGRYITRVCLGNCVCMCVRVCVCVFFFVRDKERPCTHQKKIGRKKPIFTNLKKRIRALRASRGVIVVSIVFGV